MKINIGMNSLLSVSKKKEIKNKRAHKNVKNGFYIMELSDGLKNVLSYGEIISQEINKPAESSKLDRVKAEIEMNNYNVDCKKLAYDMINL